MACISALAAASSKRRAALQQHSLSQCRSLHTSIVRVHGDDTIIRFGSPGHCTARAAACPDW
eukprot:1772226-Rhodomonas_salina.1